MTQENEQRQGERVEDPAGDPPVREAEPVDFGPAFDPEASGDSGGRNQMVKSLIFLLLPIVIAYALISFMAPSKTSYQNDITRLEMDMVAMREEITEAKTQQPDLSSVEDSFQMAIESAASGFDGKLTELEGAAATQDGLIASVRADIDKFLASTGNFVTESELNGIPTQAAVNELDTRANNLATELARLEQRIGELEDPPGNSGNSGTTDNNGEGVAAEVSTFGGLGIGFTELPSDREVTTTLRVKVTNNLSVEVSNVQVVLLLFSNIAMPAWANGYPALEGQPNWTMVATTGNMIGFGTGWSVWQQGLTLAAGETRTLYPLLRLRTEVGGEVTGSQVYFTPQVSVDGWD